MFSHPFEVKLEPIQHRYFDKYQQEYDSVSKFLSSFEREKDWNLLLNLSAKKKGLKFNLTPNDIDIPKLCPVLAIPLKRSFGTRTDNSPSIDRIDSSKGYTKSNIVIISCKANIIKLHGNRLWWKSLLHRKYR